MTNWQWKVVMALVRYVLNKEGADLGQTSIQEQADKDQDDWNTLIEAAIRDKE